MSKGWAYLFVIMSFGGLNFSEKCPGHRTYPYLSASGDTFQGGRFSDVVPDLLTCIHPELTRPDVAIELELPRELPPMRTDRVQLQQVLLNFQLFCPRQAKANGRIGIIGSIIEPP
jgi:hypothetical protein